MRSISAISILFMMGCVQPTYVKTVVFLLKIDATTSVKNIQIKGNDKPLSWDNGLVMVPVGKDSLYTATTTFKTGYKFIEMKFVVNDEYELSDKPNRRIYFSEKDTTIYNATFNKLEPSK